MAGLELRFLGDFEVRRDGRAVPLPPSKKTRALLAYLSLQPGVSAASTSASCCGRSPTTRAARCAGACPSSGASSTTRKTCGSAPTATASGSTRTASRSTCGNSRELLSNGLARISIDDLEAAAARYRGNFLEGLEFSSFHDFHTWCVAEREQSLRDRSALLTELVRRLADEPERSLPHARALVGLSPYEESYRATLIRLLNAARQPGEAEEQYQLGLRMLKEAGIPSSRCAARGAPCPADRCAAEASSRRACARGRGPRAGWLWSLRP